jgi:CHAT domain-containing protein
VEYFVFPDRLITFVVRPAGLTTHVQPVSQAALATRIRVVRELAGRKERSGALQSALEALHEGLLGPARRAGSLADVHTLLIVPQGDLEYVPFAALRDPETARFLVEDFSLLHLPSAAMLPILAARPRSPDGDGASEFFAPFPGELPASVAEAEAFTGAIPSGRSRTGATASESRVRESLARASLVHLATHGSLNARNPLFSRLELAAAAQSTPEDDGRLEVHEVNRLRIVASLVFLSGCETGLGLAGVTRFSRGEDYATLTRAFLHAGAWNVIATLWRVEDRGASEFAARFYRELARGGPDLSRGLEDLAGVLSRAQRAMLRDTAWSSPFYWAGFRLTGAGHGGAKVAVPVRS